MESLNRRQLLRVLSVTLPAYAVFGCKMQTDEPMRETAGGWRKTGEIEEFGPDNLWQHLDGEAQRYIDAGLISLATCGYQYQYRVKAVVDLFTMRDSSSARQIFLAKKTSGGSDIQLGAGGVIYEHSVLFYKGKYFARLFTFERDADALSSLVLLARDIEGRLE